MLGPAIHLLTHELASGTRTDPLAAPGAEHSNYRIYLWSGRSHPASSHVHSLRCRATRRPQRHLDVAKAARSKMVAAAQSDVSYRRCDLNGTQSKARGFSSKKSRHGRKNRTRGQPVQKNLLMFESLPTRKSSKSYWKSLWRAETFVPMSVGAITDY